MKLPDPIRWPDTLTALDKYTQCLTEFTELDLAWERVKYDHGNAVRSAIYNAHEKAKAALAEAKEYLTILIKNQKEPR